MCGVAGYAIGRNATEWWELLIFHLEPVREVSFFHSIVSLIDRAIDCGLARIIKTGEYIR